MSETNPRADTPPVNESDLGVSELPTGTVTLLLADIEGSTQLWETQPEEMQPEEMQKAVARLDHALAQTVAAHQGVRPVEQGEGDSLVVAFNRGSDDFDRLTMGEFGALAAALIKQHRAAC